MNAAPAGMPGSFATSACESALNAALAPFVADWIRELIEAGELVVKDYKVVVKVPEEQRP